MRKAIATVIAGVAFVVNPLFACHVVHLDDYEFGEKEMRTAVEGNYELVMKPARGPRQTMTFQLRQKGAANRHSSTSWITTAAACDHRTFVASAEACLDTSEMELEFLAVHGDLAPKNAGFQVIGIHFDRGTLHFDVGDDYVVAHIGPTGAILDVTLGSGTATLVRK
jgi:hypothetical protein